MGNDADDITPPPGGVPARIVDAEAKDAEAIAALLVASITELCAADHNDDPAAVARWTANKTPQTVLGWIADPGQRVLVGWESERIVSVGAVAPGEILLNYVAPEHRFRGHSKAMLKVMEACLAMIGTDRVRLSSTITARRFYLANGWVEDGAADTVFGLRGIPMTKSLRDA